MATKIVCDGDVCRMVPVDQNAAEAPPPPTNALTDLLGDSLRKGSSTVKTSEALSGKHVALYFSAHWCPPCRGFTPSLVTLYQKLQQKVPGQFEVVFVSSDRDEEAFKEYYGEMPWLALPFEDRETKNNLSSKFKIRGIPSLLLFDSSGKLYNEKGRAAVSADPEGEAFPWKPRTFQEIMSSVDFINAAGETKSFDDVKASAKTIGLYFSAHWCPPCRGFTPQFASFYRERQNAHPGTFEVIFISSDRDEAAYKDYLGEMPWLSLPFTETKAKTELDDIYGAGGIPHLVLIDHEGNVVSKKGRSGVVSAPEEFPWLPKPASDLDVDPDGIDDLPSVLVTCKESTSADEQKRIVDALSIVGKALKGKEINVFYSFARDGSISKQILHLARNKITPDANAQMLLLDFNDNGGYYIDEALVEPSSITSESVQAFAGKYLAKKLQRQQMSR